MNERIVYQIFTGSFNESLKGITQKLDYIKDLGAGEIWLTPIFSSPSYHGYDITDYYSINPKLGTMEDFEELVSEAHKRDIKIMLDMVFNHTSDQHPWFIKSREGDEQYRDYYIWSNHNPHTNQTPMNGNPWAYSVESRPSAYYYNSFCDSMPNLNHNNWKVKEEIMNICRFWINKGVDDFRLDAVRWTYFNHEEGVEFWRWFAEEVRKMKPDIYLVGECWSSDNVSKKYQDALGSCFEFELANHIIDKLNWGCLKYIGIYCDGNHNINNSLFLSNHDLNRILTDLFNSKSKMKIASALLFSLPGTPYIYYSEELGMLGTKEFGDEGVRKPMPWEEVEAQKQTPSSLYRHYKNLIRIRNNEVALRKGTFENITTNNDHALIFKRRYKNEEITVCMNQVKDAKEYIPAGLYKVVYSNKGYIGYLSTTGDIELEADEILFLKRL